MILEKAKAERAIPGTVPRGQPARAKQVRLHAAALNGAMSGFDRGAMRELLPTILGSDGAGVVSAVGQVRVR